MHEKPMAEPPCDLRIDARHERLYDAWQAHLAARGTIQPETEDFVAFGSISRVEALRTTLNLIEPGATGPVRKALKRMRSEKWRETHPVPETAENRKTRRAPKISVPEKELPGVWKRALRDMRHLQTNTTSGLIVLDDRKPPAPKVVQNIASTLRCLAWTCIENGFPVELTIETVDLYRAARHAAGNKHRSIALRLKELKLFAQWCELDEALTSRIGRLQRRYSTAGANETKEKDVWASENDLCVGQVWEKAEALLRQADRSPRGTARRAYLVQDAACIALSVVCPLRCGDLHRIRLGDELARSAEGWSLHMETAKTGAVYDRGLLWPELTPFLDAVVTLDSPETDFWSAYDRRSGSFLFSWDFGDTAYSVAWPTRCWERHFGIGEHFVRSLWHSMMFESEDDDQWIALALCGQDSARTAQEYILQGKRKRAARSGRAKLRALRRQTLNGDATHPAV